MCVIPACKQAGLCLCLPMLYDGKLGSMIKQIVPHNFRISTESICPL